MASNLDVIFVGGGGHAAVCRDVFESDGRRVIGYVAPDRSDLDLEYLGEDTELDDLTRRHSAEIFVAIGSNSLRARLLARIGASGLVAASAVDAGARVARSVTVGSGTVVMPGAVINARATIGDGVIINTSASVDHDVTIEAFSHVAPGSHLAGNVHIARGAFLGVGTMVIPGCSIGAWTTIGAGSAVISDIVENCVAVGVPARVIRIVPEGESN